MTIKVNIMFNSIWFHAYCLKLATKNIIQPSFAFPPLHCDFYKSFATVSIDH